MLVVSSKVTGATVDSYVVLVTSELESDIVFRFWSGGVVELLGRLLENDIEYGRWVLRGGDVSSG